MQFNQKFQGCPTPACPISSESVKIIRLLTFYQSLRFRLEKFAFDASEPLDWVPYISYPVATYVASPKKGVQQTVAQLKAMRQELDLLIDDLGKITC